MKECTRCGTDEDVTKTINGEPYCSSCAKYLLANPATRKKIQEHDMRNAGMTCGVCDKPLTKDNLTDRKVDGKPVCKACVSSLGRENMVSHYHECSKCGNSISCDNPNCDDKYKMLGPSKCDRCKASRNNSLEELVAEDVKDPKLCREVLNEAGHIILSRKNAVRATVDPKRYSFKFIEPGLVKYEDVRNTGHVLVQKEALDRMLPTFVGKPIINMMHAETDPAKFREQADGIITRAWYNATDGWYWAEGLVWDPDTQKTCDLGANSKKFSVSCAYDPTDGTEEGGDWHNIPYEGEITNGKYTHLAIVPNPRYEKAGIFRLNSKGGSTMLKVFAWLKGEKKELDPEATTLVNGKPMKIADLVSEVEKAQQRQNASPELTDETEIEIAGVKTTLGEAKKRLNAKDDEEESDEEKAKKKKDAEEKERKNALDLEEKKKKEEEERRNAKHFEDLEANRRKVGVGVETEIESKADAVKRGKELF